MRRKGETDPQIVHYIKILNKIMKLNIAVLPGDGIGPEIMPQAIKVLDAVAKKFNHEFAYHEAICGAHAIDEVGDPFPEATFKTCMEADAVLFAAVGDLRFDNDPTLKVRPETGLLAMRKQLGLFANVRPVATFDCLLHNSPSTAKGGNPSVNHVGAAKTTPPREINFCPSQ